MEYTCGVLLTLALMHQAWYNRPKISGDGLVEVLPRRGTFVAGLTRKAAQETFEIRCMIELTTAKHLLDAPPSFADQMAQIQREIASLVDNQSFAEFEQYIVLDTDFHQYIVDLMGNEPISQFHRELRWSIQVMRGLTAAHHERAQLTLGELTSIVRAIRN